MISTGVGSGCLLKTFRANRLIWENQVGSGTVAGISSPFLGGVHHLLHISYQKPLIYDHLPEPEKSVERRNGKEITMNLFLMPESFPTCLGILIQLSPSFLGLLCIIPRQARGITCVQFVFVAKPRKKHGVTPYLLLQYLLYHCNFPWIPDTATSKLIIFPHSVGNHRMLVREAPRDTIFAWNTAVHPMDWATPRRGQCCECVHPAIEWRLCQTHLSWGKQKNLPPIRVW